MPSYPQTLTVKAIVFSVKPMLDFITHSAAVHVPLAVAVLHPLAFAATWVGIDRYGIPAKAWFFPLAACVIQMVATGLAYVTGLRDRVLSAAEPALLAQHEELALLFTILWALILAGHIGVFLLQAPKSRRLLAQVTLVLLAAQAGVAILLGRLGGALMIANG